MPKFMDSGVDPSGFLGLRVIAKPGGNSVLSIQSSCVVQKKANDNCQKNSKDVKIATSTTYQLHLIIPNPIGAMHKVIQQTASRVRFGLISMRTASSDDLADCRVNAASIP